MVILWKILDGIFHFYIGLWVGWNFSARKNSGDSICTANFAASQLTLAKSSALWITVTIVSLTGDLTRPKRPAKLDKQSNITNKWWNGGSQLWLRKIISGTLEGYEWNLYCLPMPVQHLLSKLELWLQTLKFRGWLTNRESRSKSLKFRL